MFQHFLITRFNLRNPDWKFTKNGDKILNAEWLENRLDLFKSFCLPSVQNQRNKNFSWEIFFDIETPEYFKKMIRELEWGNLNVDLHFIDGLQSLQGSLIKIINGKAKPNCEFIITTRMDNDDIIHKKFIDTIQKMFVPESKTILDLRYGYQITLDNNSPIIRNYNNSFNPFISLIEDKNCVETIYSRMHREWKDVENVLTNEKRLWVELVHQKNQLNKEHNHLERSLFFNLRDFGMNKSFTVKLDRSFIFLGFSRLRSKIIFILRNAFKKLIFF